MSENKGLIKIKYNKPVKNGSLEKSDPTYSRDSTSKRKRFLRLVKVK